MHVTDHKDDFYDFTKERENYYKERFKNIKAISKAVCFDNPETKYIKDLIVRIKDGMNFIKTQEKNHSITKSDLSDLSDWKENKIKSDYLKKKNEKANESEVNNKFKRYYRGDAPEKDSIDDFLKDYNRSGDYNDRFKKLKKKKMKKNPADFNNDNKSQETIGKNKSSIALKEDVRVFGHENKELKDQEYIENLNSNNVFFKYSKKLNRFNSANINSNKILKLSESKSDRLVKSFAPKKVVELFSQLKNASSLFNENLKNKNETQNQSTNFMNSLIKENNLSAADKDDKVSKDSLHVFKSSFKIDLQVKEKNTLNFTSSSIINAESFSKNQIKLYNLSKEKSNFNNKWIKKNNKTFITHKIQIKKMPLDDWKKEISNALYNSIDLSINTQRKKETFKISDNCNPANKLSEFVNFKKRPLSQFYKSNKITEIKSEEKLKIGDDKIQSKITSELILLLTENSKLEAINNHPENINKDIPPNVKNSPYKKILEQPAGEIKIFLNTVNREIGEFNNNEYIINNNNKKNNKDLEVSYEKENFNKLKIHFVNKVAALLI
jgi:hypothetical protein